LCKYDQWCHNKSYQFLGVITKVNGNWHSLQKLLPIGTLKQHFRFVAVFFISVKNRIPAYPKCNQPMTKEVNYNYYSQMTIEKRQKQTKKIFRDQQLETHRHSSTGQKNSKMNAWYERWPNCLCNVKITKHNYNDYTPSIYPNQKLELGTYIKWIIIHNQYTSLASVTYVRRR
jgi:hypothetical protein